MRKRDLSEDFSNNMDRKSSYGHGRRITEKRFEQKATVRKIERSQKLQPESNGRGEVRKRDMSISNEVFSFALQILFTCFSFLNILRWSFTFIEYHTWYFCQNSFKILLFMKPVSFLPSLSCLPPPSAHFLACLFNGGYTALPVFPLFHFTILVLYNLLRCIFAVKNALGLSYIFIN